MLVDRYVSFHPWSLYKHLLFISCTEGQTKKYASFQTQSTRQDSYCLALFFSNFDLMPTVRSGGENVKHNVCHVYFDWPNDYRPIGNCKIISNSGKYIISYT